MKLKLIFPTIVFFLSNLAASTAYAVSTYDALSNQLSIPQVKVGEVTYGNVVVTIKDVISIESDRLQTSYADASYFVDSIDSYNSQNNVLRLSNVQAFGTIFANVRVSIDRVISVGGVIGENLGVRRESFASPSGDDSNAGTINAPFRSAQRCANSLTAGGVCYLREGTYYESITPLSNTTISAYRNEVVTIDGTDRIPNESWSVYKGNIYKTQINLSKGDLNQIFVKQKMMTEARWPNGFDLFHPIWSNAQSGTNDTSLVDANMPDLDLTGSRIWFWSGNDPWAPLTAKVTSSTKGQARFNLDGAAFQDYIKPQEGGYYYIFGHLNLLDSPQEWFYDESSSTLYFWADENKDPRTLDVKAKRRQWAFDLSGKEYVSIVNINIFASNIFTDPNSNGNSIDGIVASFINHFTTLPDLKCPWSGCKIYPSSYWMVHLGDSGIIINGKNNKLTNSTIQYSSGNGVSLMGSNNLISNNLIHHVAYSGNYTSGIVIGGENHSITKNTIHSVPRFALFLTEQRSWPYVYPNGNDISYNNIFNCVMFSRDAGCIYSGNIPTSGTRIHHNWIHDSQNIHPGPASDFTVNGIYFDEDTSGYSVYQNVIWNVGKDSIMIHGSSVGQSTGMDLSIYNNSVIDANPNARINLQDVNFCGTTRIANNLTLSPVRQVFYSSSGPNCSQENNGPNAPGATEMLNVIPGCNFAGCSSSAPPTIVNGMISPSIAYQPYDISVTTGQPAKFVTIGNGSGTISYQWQRNGVNIPGANDSKYLLNSTSSSDSGSTFRAVITTPLGTVTSNSATLTVK